jgi:hypothetical protein
VGIFSRRPGAGAGQPRPHWHAIVNVSGYLPESDDASYPYETWSDALSALVDELDRAWDSAAELDDEQADAQYLEAHTAMHGATEGQDFLAYTPTHMDSERDIPTAWQVVACTETECFEDGE